MQPPRHKALTYLFTRLPLFGGIGDGLLFTFQIDTSSYVESNEWELLGCPAVKNIETYPCCPEPFPDLTFTIVMKRIPIFYMIILIIPCILLSLLTLVSFWLPPETPAKILLGKSTLNVQDCDAPKVQVVFRPYRPIFGSIVEVRPTLKM